MIEFLRHMFGFCGEHWHPNIWTVIFGGASFTTATVFVKHKVKQYGTISLSYGEPMILTLFIL